MPPDRRRLPTVPDMPSARSEWDGWFQALDRLIPTPADLWEGSIDDVGASRLFRCGADLLDALVERGLPARLTDAGRYYDIHELFNVALYSGSKRSLPELALSMITRFAREPVPQRIELGRWSLLADFATLDGSATPWSVARPTPEALGGSLTSLETKPAFRKGERSRLAVVEPVSRVTLRAGIELQGRVDRVVSPAIREVFHGFLARPWLWYAMPRRLSTDLTAVTKRNTTDCISASLLLARELGERGYEARTRLGLLTNLFGTLHGWVEVRDDDGRWKLLEPGFALLAKGWGFGGDEFIEFCLGSTSNRCLPLSASVDEPLAAAVGDAVGVRVGQHIRFQPCKAPAATPEA
jgi:hypothetical protein